MADANTSSGTRYALACTLLDQLRKELVETQRIRAQTIGAKITFVTAVTGVIAASGDRLIAAAYALPAFAAIFFDLLINSYSASILRIAVYLRVYVEPVLRTNSGWPATAPLWEEAMARPGVRSRLAVVGNLGLTGLVVVAGAVGTVRSLPSVRYLAALGGLLAFFAYDAITHLRPGTAVARSLVSDGTVRAWPRGGSVVGTGLAAQATHDAAAAVTLPDQQPTSRP